jgi:16S rRNA (cytosine1402-N4)-methyltransferase
MYIDLKRKTVQIPHLPVLLDETVKSFQGMGNGYFVDCTLGYAGHSSAILERYPGIRLVGIDRDQEALDFSKKRLACYGDRVELCKGAFSDIFGQLNRSPIVGVLADFGVSSLQLDKKDRGFGFESDVLDMRMDSLAALSAFDVVNGYSREALEYIFEHYGEITPPQKLTAAILEARAKEPIKSAKALSEIALRVLGRKGKIHPATLMFQAIRIEVNDELGEIERLLDALETKGSSGAIVSLITFHSLEDRLVKTRFKKWQEACICGPHAIRCTCGKNHSLGKMLVRKPIVADAAELKKNPRSRSAKLRTFCFNRVDKESK